jgi:Zn-dependent protease
MDFSTIFSTVLVYAIPVLLAITLHEAAHGYAALRLGDDTAYVLGRVTLNPLRHIDPIGTIAMPLLLYLATNGNFLFGYAKPVPVRFGHLNNPKRDMIWVALAGPASNLLQALAWGVLFYLLPALGVHDQFFILMCKAGLLVNVVMFVFNLFPLPPLDGGRILVGLLPNPYAYQVSRVEPWGFFIVMGLVIAGVVNTIWMTPLMGLTYDLLDTVLTPLKLMTK